MSGVSHETGLVRKRPRWSPQILVPELWPSLVIAVIWLAVLFDAIFGPNIVTSNGAGTNTSSVPSAVVVALFAFLATWVVARYAFRRR
jgi:hypothetical protein